MNMDLYTLFISSLADGTAMPFVHYDNREAAEVHRDHINLKRLVKNNPLRVGESFVRKTSSVVRSTFGGE